MSIRLCRHAETMGETDSDPSAARSPCLRRITDTLLPRDFSEGNEKSGKEILPFYLAEEV